MFPLLMIVWLLLSYKNILILRHIIIDGASTDGTLSILESKRHQFAAWIARKIEAFIML